jgi:hypothetical protein
MFDETVIDAINEGFNESDGKTTEEVAASLSKIEEHCKEMKADLLS